MSAEMCDVTGPAKPMRDFGAGSSGVVRGEVQAERLADLSDWARRLSRPQQADRFLLHAWLAFDSDASF
jgi:hypothetical protein